MTLNGLRFVCDASWFGATEEVSSTWDNFSVYAAAPELLEALNMAKSTLIVLIKSYNLPDRVISILQYEINQIDSAIAKAEGRAS